MSETGLEEHGGDYDGIVLAWINRGGCRDDESERTLYQAKPTV